MFLSYLIEISLLWLLLEATAAEFQRCILRDFFMGLPCESGRQPASRQDGPPPGRAGAAAPHGGRSPRSLGNSEQTPLGPADGSADADTAFY